MIYINGNYQVKIKEEGDIIIMIPMDSQCCERYDALFLETPDNINNYIGATILAIEDVCTSSACLDNDDCNETQLKVTTSKGVLQYAVYNSHNGCYSHATFVQVFDTIEHGSL